MISIYREKKSLINNAKKWKKTGKIPVNNRLSILKLKKPLVSRFSNLLLKSNNRLIILQ